MIARRKLLAFVAALPLALSGCGGWEAVYADRSMQASAPALRAIKVNPIPERVGQQLETGLRNSFNPDNVPTKPLYALAVTLTKSLSNSGIQSQGLGTRGDVQLVAAYQLIDMANNKIVQNGFIRSTDSFDIQANGYSTVVAQDDAARRDVEELRREIVARLTLFMQGKLPATL